MPDNDALPRIEVDPDTFTVRIDGEVVEPAPVDRAADGPALLPLLAADPGRPPPARLRISDSHSPTRHLPRWAHRVKWRVGEGSCKWTGG